MRRFLQNNLLILVLLNSSNLFNYLFQLVVGRALTPSDYGSFNALNSMAVILAAPVAVLPLVFSRYTIKLAQAGLGQVKSLLVEGLRGMIIIVGGSLLFGISIIPWLKNYLHLDTSLPILIMLVQLALALVLPVFLGILQGLHRFFPFGLGFSSISLGRFLAGCLLVLVLSWGVNGALLAGAIGTCFAISIAFWSTRDILREQGSPLPHGFFKEMGKYAFPVFISTTMVMALGNLDIVLVRHYCQPEEAGLYATAAILGRIALFLPGVLITVLFPEAAKVEAKGHEDSRILWVSLGLTALLGGSFALACTFWPEQIIVLLFGAKYQAAAELLKVISLAMAMLAIANVIFTYCLARSEFKFLWPLASGVAMMLSLIFFFHDSALTIAKMVLFSIGVILIGTLSWYFLRSARPATSP
ncbi:MAG: capsular polysaccharide biosynthesis protein [Nitrospinaceae bacterium]|nr:MAG: capsular polysaccharide biosynthesis protein [Nitrospinaceae bacterium]